MALQQFVCCFTVLIIFLCKGSEQLTCGMAQRNNRILGGQDATPGSWPWYTVVSEFFGGTLITDQWVLTSAFIAQLDGSSVVYLGRYSRLGLNPNEVNRTVENITCHPNYSSSTLENNICLLKLSAPVNFTDYIQPICLASENSTFNNGTSGWAIGFGSDGVSQFSNILQEVNLPIVGNDECKKSYPYPFLDPAINNGICAGGGVTTTPCQFDNGGPLMTKKGSVWVQSGVLSLSSCNLRGSYSLYTPVSQYQKWISDTITGTPLGFVTFTSPGTATAPPTLPATAPPTLPATAPPTLPATAPPTLPATAPPTLPATAPPTLPATAPPTLPATAPPTLPATAPPTLHATAPPTLPPTAPPTLPPTLPPTAPPTLPPTAPPTLPPTAPPTHPATAPTTLICESVLCCGETLIHFTHFTSLCALVVLLHIFAGTGGT